ncbi:MAG: chemotaxis protein CheR [Rickettsiales bacterium]|nr:chemotaxis protein CheR [Rickettsiales bacterium]|tara:strand:- start:4 stop:819 length:816 start_codon:yes stop_codon:yes gene_type:complete
MEESDFEAFQDVLKKTSGLVIGMDKCYLLESRLRPVIDKYNLADISMLASRVRANQKSPEAWDVVEAMTTNETSFFRDTRPFDIFKNHVMPKLMETNQATKKIRIWSAACSSGQEPYTLAMVIKEAGWLNQGWNFEIVGTDISKDILEVAKQGLYSQFEVQRGLPITLLVKYFKQIDEKWQINDDIKSMIKYSHFNLLHPLSSLGKFDIIMCRNVLIYFDQPTKKTVLENMSNILNNDGYLFLGGAETVIGITDKYKTVPDQRGLYEKDQA